MKSEGIANCRSNPHYACRNHRNLSCYDVAVIEAKRLHNSNSNWGFLVFLLAGAASCHASTQQTVSAGTILRPIVRGDGIILSRLHAGASIHPEFTKAVYWRDKEVIPAGSMLHIIVDRAEKKPTPHSGWARRVTSLITNSPRQTPAYDISVRSAVLTVPGGSATPIDISVLAFLNHKRIYARSERIRTGKSKPRERHSILVLEVRRDFSVPMPALVSVPAPSAPLVSTMILPAGTRASIMLLHRLSGSVSREGDGIEARLLHPIVVDGTVAIPEGSRFEGRLVHRMAPRRLMRAGALRLNFTKAILSTGGGADISTSVSAIDADANSGPHTHVDSEGNVSGGSTSKKRLVVDLGLAYLTGKIADDLLEEGVKYALGAAVSGAAATAARYVGIGTGLLFLAMQRGNDVCLPQYTELELTFSRPVHLAFTEGDREQHSSVAPPN